MGSVAGETICGARDMAMNLIACTEYMGLHHTNPKLLLAVPADYGTDQFEKIAI